MRRTVTVSLVGFLALVLSVFTAGTAYAHGYVQDPPSRAYLCSIGKVDNCGAIQWEPQSVEGPGGFPEAGPSNGHLCSGGNGRFGELDGPGAPDGGDWPAKSVSGGQTLTFDWHNLARHATANWRYYITKPGWDSGSALTRSDLDLDPIATFDGHGQQPGAHTTHQVALPNRSGHHLVFAVWEIADTANAFYSCVDLDFSGRGGGGDGGGDGGGGGGDDGGSGGDQTCDAAAWESGAVYTDGDVVTYNGHEWRAKWWTRQQPAGSQWGPWADLGSCG